MFCVSNRPTAKTATNASGSAPVKSIRVYQGHAQIISSDCILCGNCVSVCPQHAKEDISDVAQIQELIASGQQVVVSVDSSYIAYFDTPGFAGIAEPLKKLGFAAAHETAEGAYLVKKELEKLAAQPGDAPIITSGCSTIVPMWKSTLPEALPYLAPVLSPMQAHAVLLRKRLSRRDHCLCQPLHFQERGDDAL